MTATEIVSHLVDTLLSDATADADADALIYAFALVESNRIIVAELLQQWMSDGSAQTPCES